MTTSGTPIPLWLDCDPGLTQLKHPILLNLSITDIFPRSRRKYCLVYCAHGLPSLIRPLSEKIGCIRHPYRSSSPVPETPGYNNNPRQCFSGKHHHKCHKVTGSYWKTRDPCLSRYQKAVLQACSSRTEYSWSVSQRERNAEQEANTSCGNQVTPESMELISFLRRQRLRSPTRTLSSPCAMPC